MTGKKKTKMNFQSAVELVSAPPEEGKTEVESLVDACKKCGFLKDRIVRTKEELPNPRAVRHLMVGDVIDLNDRAVRAVTQALYKKGITRIGDLLDRHPAEIFVDLKVSDEQKLQFVVAIESAGVRFTSSTASGPTPEM